MTVYCLIDNVGNQIAGIYSTLELAEIAQVELSASQGEGWEEQTSYIAEVKLDESLV